MTTEPTEQHFFLWRLGDTKAGEQEIERLAEVWVGEDNVFHSTVIDETRLFLIKGFLPPETIQDTDGPRRAARTDGKAYMEILKKNLDNTGYNGLVPKDSGRDAAPKSGFSR